MKIYIACSIALLVSLLCGCGYAQYTPRPIPPVPPLSTTNPPPTSAIPLSSSPSISNTPIEEKAEDNSFDLTSLGTLISYGIESMRDLYIARMYIKLLLPIGRQDIPDTMDPPEFRPFFQHIKSLAYGTAGTFATSCIMKQTTFWLREDSPILSRLANAGHSLSTFFIIKLFDHTVRYTMQRQLNKYWLPGLYATTGMAYVAQSLLDVSLFFAHQFCISYFPSLGWLASSLYGSSTLLSYKLLDAFIKYGYEQLYAPLKANLLLQKESLQNEIIDQQVQEFFSLLDAVYPQIEENFYALGVTHVTNYIRWHKRHTKDIWGMILYAQIPMLNLQRV